jgi:hypothetical protein
VSKTSTKRQPAAQVAVAKMAAKLKAASTAKQPQLSGRLGSRSRARRGFPFEPTEALP